MSVAAAPPVGVEKDHVAVHDCAGCNRAPVDIECCKKVDSLSFVETLLMIVLRSRSIIDHRRGGRDNIGPADQHCFGTVNCDQAGRQNHGCKELLHDNPYTVRFPWQREPLALTIYF